MKDKQNRSKLQFLGFAQTPALWTSTKDFPWPQYKLPEIPKFEKIALPDIPEPLPLGKRVEYFFKMLIENFSEESIIKNNEQITKDKITIGELDFLLENSITKQITHVELVYKFYVYDPTFKDEKSRYIGPNRRDSLLQKLDKLQNQQFPLLYKSETKVLLKELGISAETVVQKVCFKAMVFLPKHFSAEKIKLINPNCIAGYWLHFEDFTPETYQEYEFFAPEKQDWPIAPKYCTSWISYTQIKIQIDQLFEKGKSPLIWMKKNQTSFERFFVVWW